jgi:hypothetical protein
MAEELALEEAPVAVEVEPAVAAVAAKVELQCEQQLKEKK